MRIREKRRRANRAVRFFILIFSLAAVAVAVVFAVGLLPGSLARQLGPASPSLSPAERAVMAAYLTAHLAELNAPAGSDASPVEFSVNPGATAVAVAQKLAGLGIVHDAQLLTYYMRYQGLDGKVEAGDFVLRQTMNLREVAVTLTDASARELVLRVIEGWRREQISEALAAQPAFARVAADFLALTGPNGPVAGTYPFLAEVAPGAGLEGFLFPDTYLLRPNATASDIRDKILADFQGRLPPNYRAQVAAHGLTVYQAITMASLIEREAAVDDERPVIASVLYNRLAAGQRLEIDATVQYVAGKPGNWWPTVGGLDLRSVDSPYNTYASSGLPPGPIANPGLSSIRAVASPAQTNYLYYRAQCDGSGRHAFAVTYAEHLANACP
jgi:UPF0755 protein